MIRVEELTKYYGEQAAILDLSFSIERGEVIGFLGLNGAGKSTTLKILGCVLLPTSGTVTIDGHDAVKNPLEVRKRIGFLPDSPPLYDEMTVRSYLRFVAELRGLGKEVGKRVEEAAAKTGLAQVIDEPVGSLSHGYRQRVGIAQALVHKPALLILDEPTSGLDPVQIVEMRQLIKDLRGEQTILLSSHNLPEISQTCDRLLVIQDGQLVAQDSESGLGAAMGQKVAVEIEVIGAGAKVVDALKGLEGVNGTKIVSNGEASVVHVDADPATRPSIVRALVAAKLDVLRVDAKGRGSQLESIFLQLTNAKS